MAWQEKEQVEHERAAAHKRRDSGSGHWCDGVQFANPTDGDGRGRAAGVSWQGHHGFLVQPTCHIGGEDWCHRGRTTAVHRVGGCDGRRILHGRDDEAAGARSQRPVRRYAGSAQTGDAVLLESEDDGGCQPDPGAGGDVFLAGAGQRREQRPRIYDLVNSTKQLRCTPCHFVAKAFGSSSGRF